MPDSYEPMSTWRILWEALKLPTKNWPLFLPIFLLNLLSSSLLYLTNYYSIYPLIAKLTVPTDDFHDLYHLIAELTVVESLFMIISFIVSSFLTIVTVKATTATYLSDYLTLKELFTKVKKSWKGPVITQLLVLTITFVCMLFLVMIIFFTLVISHGNSLSFIIIFFVLFLVVLFSYRGLAAVCAVAVIVPVLEDGCYGVRALVRAVELIKEKKRQGTGIALLVAGGGLVGANAFSAASAPSAEGNYQLVKGLLIVSIMGVWNVVGLAAYSLFYYECKKSRGEEIATSIEDEFMYASISNGDPDFPSLA